MDNYLYPTWTVPENEWVKDMLYAWQETEKQYLCFPWVKFKVHTLRHLPFWMYFYYSKTWSKNSSKAGMVEFRVHVADWSLNKFFGENILLWRGKEDGTAWF